MTEVNLLPFVKEIHLAPEPDLGGIDPAAGTAQEDKKDEETVPF